jgi:hypothetical protein
LNGSLTVGFLCSKASALSGSLLFTGLALRMDAKTRRVSTVLTITQDHRELWSNLYKRPALSRVLDPNVDLARRPVTHEEEMFILLLVVHLHTSLEVLKPGMRDEPDEGLRKDILWFFSLPIPNAVWEQAKVRQDASFVRFVESCRV